MRFDNHRAVYDLYWREIRKECDVWAHITIVPATFDNRERWYPLERVETASITLRVEIFWHSFAIWKTVRVWPPFWDPSEIRDNAETKTDSDNETELMLDCVCAVHASRKGRHSA